MKNKVNLIAVILASLLLAITWFWMEDVLYYQECLIEREKLAEEVATTIKNGISINSEEIEAKDARISEKVQALSERTDWGELLAKNDKTTDGRGNNCLITGVVFIIMITAGLVILWNVFVMCWNIFLFFKYLPENTRKLEHDVKNKLNEVSGVWHDLINQLKTANRNGRFWRK